MCVSRGSSAGTETRTAPCLLAATLAVIAGASLKDTMTRIGHSTVTAAMIYQHAAEGKGKEIAARLSEIAAGESPQS